jgi:uncharacterized membrane-anchored protein
MLKRHRYLVLGVLLAVAIATGVSAAEDNADTKRCGGYYACIEFQPVQPDYVFGQWRSSITNPGSASP